MCDELDKIAIQNLEILDSLNDDIDNYRLIIDGKKLSISDDTYEGIFNLTELEYPIYFTFTHLLNSLRYSNLYKIENYKTKELLDLMDNSIDRISSMTDSMETDPNHKNMSDIIDGIDNKFLIARERAFTCSMWKIFETFNDYLDTITEALKESEKYLYTTEYKVINNSENDSENDSVDACKNSDTQELNPNLVYDEKEKQKEN